MSVKVKKIKVQNLKAVGSAELDLNGCSVLVIGKNNSGKTTILTALPERLRGEKPDAIKVIKHDETEGFTEWELSDGTKLIWSLDTKTKAGERLVIVRYDAEGKEERGSITKEIMNEYFPDLFDVDAFLLSTPAKQRKTLQGLAGIDFTKIDDQYKVAYDDRTFANRKLEDAKALLKPVNTTLALVEDEDTVTKLQQEINGIDHHNSKYEEAEAGLGKVKKELSTEEGELKKLQALVKSSEAKIKELGTRIKNGETWLAAPDNKPKDEAHLEKITSQLNEVKLQNAKIKSNNEAISNRDKVATLTDNAKTADNKVKEILADKDKLIRSAKMPDGFGFGEEGITYNGFDFDKISQSSSGRYIAGLKLAKMSIGKVQCLHFDASFLDKVSLAEVEQWANEEGLQLLIERPDFEAGEIHYELITDIK